MPTFDAVSTVIGTGGNPTSVSHTVANQPNRLLLVAVGSIAGAGSAVTYAGVSMTEVASEAVGGQIHIRIYRLIAPSTGANDISVTTGGAKVYVIGLSYYNVDQVNPLGAFVQRTEAAVGNGGTSTLTPASITSDLVVDFLGLDNQGSGVGNATAGAGQTVRANHSDADQRHLNSEEAGAAGTTTMSWTLTDLGVGATNNVVHLAVAIKPPTGNYIMAY